jgi:Ca-activated chloride channel family protein
LPDKKDSHLKQLKQNYMKTIVLTLGISLISILNCFSQNINVKGIVKDSDGLPLPGSTIIIQGTTRGTITDIDGLFDLNASKNDVLEISFIGLKSKTVVIKDTSFINIALEEGEALMDEIVVSGYSSKGKKVMVRGLSSLGSMASVSPSYQYNSTNASSSFNVTENESYSKIDDNGFKTSKNSPLATFSIDVDRASYSNVRRLINNGIDIPKDAVRVEEMINYFKYDYPQPTGIHPFSINTEVSVCPWNKDHKIIHIGVQGKEIPTENLPASNLVFLIDVSGSMNSQNKLPLLKSSLKMLVDKLRTQDKVAIVVYAGAAGMVLPSTDGNKKSLIKGALDKLSAGGSTAGGAGINLAYKIAEESFIEGGNNRIIIATDGDFNVGASGDSDMERLIEEKRKSGIFLTCLGYGMGNYKDSKMETLANKGNGNYAYIDNIQEAQKTLVTEFGGTMFTIAKDVKIQVEFNPVEVQAYRLVGYENRLLNDEDFTDDTKDAGELGSGHTVTAIYEIIPVGVKSPFIKDIPLKYQETKTVNSNNSEIATIKFRYKKPEEGKSLEFAHIIENEAFALEECSDNLRFASSVAMFGMLLRDSEYKNISTYEEVIKLASAARGKDEDGYRAEFIRLVKSVK